MERIERCQLCGGTVKVSGIPDFIGSNEICTVSCIPVDREKLKEVRERLRAMPRIDCIQSEAGRSCGFADAEIADIFSDLDAYLAQGGEDGE